MPLTDTDNTTGFISSYRSHFQRWANELQRTPGTIVAIARKGPRLIELLIRENLLPKGFMSRVISERALPFIDTASDNLIVIDDAMSFGSTFKRVFYYAEKTIEYRKGSGKAIGLPFALGERVHENYKIKVSQSFLSLKDSDIAAFVDAEITTFPLLGKPYDVEHPIFSIRGDFENLQKLESILQSVTLIVGGTLIPMVRYVPVSDGIYEVYNWTITLANNTNRIQHHSNSELFKYRIYLNPEKNRLSVCAISPLELSIKQANAFCTSLPSPLRAMWSRVYKSALLNEADSHYCDSTERSLIMWANYLYESLALKKIVAVLLAEFSEYDSGVNAIGIHGDDIRLLLGEAYAREFAPLLSSFIEHPSAECNMDFSAHAELATNRENIFSGEKIPDDFNEGYLKYRNELLEQASNTDEALKAIFYAQHIGIEIPSRRIDVSEFDRLEFGVTFKKLSETLSSIRPDFNPADFNRAFDTLVDNGSIVPRYIKANNDTGIWVRVFRVGEGSVQKTIHTIRLLFEKLAEAIKSDTIPRELFEKYCVLTLCLSGDKLSRFRCLEIKKGFHIYGARSVIQSGGKDRFLLDWAESHKIFDPASKEGYRLMPSLNALYPSNECPWGDEEKDIIEDIASFTGIIHTTPKLRDAAMVVLTSLASNNEVYAAVESELDLWLHHETSSIYDVLNELAELSRHERPSEPQLQKANNVLVNCSRILSQAKEKLELAKKRNDFYGQISASVGQDKGAKRIWRDLLKSLTSRESLEVEMSGFNQIHSTLMIASRTTSLLRNLLSLAGFKHERAIPIEESIKQFLSLVESDSIDASTKDIFERKDIPLSSALKKLPANFTSYAEALGYLRPVVLEAASRSEKVLELYQSKFRDELPTVMEPPKYIVMWDVRGSTDETDRSALEKLIQKANYKIQGHFGDDVYDFKPLSKDDGNGLITNRFSDIKIIHQILTSVFSGKLLRIGCEVNMQGHLNYYSKSKSLGGRAYEYAARITNFFKEIKDGRWDGATVPAEPNETYVVVGEFAKRYAEANGEWPLEGLAVSELPGNYTPRVNGAIPIKVVLLHASATLF